MVLAVVHQPDEGQGHHRRQDGGDQPGTLHLFQKGQGPLGGPLHRQAGPHSLPVPAALRALLQVGLHLPGGLLLCQALQVGGQQIPHHTAVQFMFHLCHLP